MFRPGRRALDRPIDSWTYTPSYFPQGFSIEVANHIPDHEPLLYFLPFARTTLVEERDPAKPTRIGAIVNAVLHLPQTMVMSAALESLVNAGVIQVEPAREYGIDLHHVGGGREIIDLHPVLPLRFIPVDWKEKRPAA